MKIASKGVALCNQRFRQHDLGPRDWRNVGEQAGLVTDLLLQMVEKSSVIGGEAPLLLELRQGRLHGIQTELKSSIETLEASRHLFGGLRRLGKMEQLLLHLLSKFDGARQQDACLAGQLLRRRTCPANQLDDLLDQSITQISDASHFSRE